MIGRGQYVSFMFLVRFSTFSFTLWYSRKLILILYFFSRVIFGRIPLLSLMSAAQKIPALYQFGRKKDSLWAHLFEKERSGTVYIHLAFSDFSEYMIMKFH